MNKKSDDAHLSSVELVVLARFSGSKKPSDEDLSAALGEFCADAKLATRGRSLVEALAARGLLVSDPPKKRSTAKIPPLAYKLSDLGGSVLCDRLGLDRIPTWTQVRNEHLPALGLGLIAGSEDARLARSNLAMTMVRMKLKMPKGASLTEISDELLFRKLGFRMSKVTLADLRARVLGESLGVKEHTKAKSIVESAAASWLKTKEASKASLSSALARDWVAGQATHWLEQVPTTKTSSPSPLPAAPAGAATPITPEALADVVYDLLPHIEAAGRFSPEKVFVSAVWRDVEKSRRLPAMTLDSFKRNLVQAMRAGKVRLARADLVGAMNPTLVSESEISDAGSTFHFVLEQRNGTQGSARRSHV